MRHKVVFHVDQPDHWAHTMQNVANLTTYVESEPKEQLQVTVLVNGAAITQYLDQDGQNAVRRFPEVEFHACHNSMTTHHVTADQLPEGVTVVPVGVLDLIKLQESGYAYIKP
ncbi:MAG: DsrE family protein [Furfurilactobacillus sp.]|jgi:intracellular sulfur oxidation DsrE/DsrF family protein|uniref:DsrE family protein n=1 Tax=Furfurilactobacillus milii TaxID=2888272 RepID=A0ABT6D9Y6_9LACO|nr:MULTISPECIES: DsrE family protein [Furfurilactobacillus]QLE66585.1 hypothetical protein LROSL2_1235 [Furfurilactobacillus rossiae]MCF6160037.1 DsrE family protein [Furfurilactobacillus milii]MCF6162414.1 DsrE family protein [Furfurilactobacillus milii]MCF6419934.1 DsrE family protein [Furfurilactobacillus milii]MCH4010709.1 DsrE family protein [Furfurilactobacillus sp.]